MGRAIVREPQVFLMDEPLSNLDAKLRTQMRAEIAGLQRELGVTTMYVTHDQVEAMTMGTRIAVLRGGLLQQQGPPQDLYDEPDNLFVAAFIGSPGMNLLRGRIEAEGGGVVCAVAGTRFPAPDAVAARAGADVAVGLRPESLFEPARGTPAAPRLKGRVRFAELLGAEQLVQIELDARPVIADDVLDPDEPDNGRALVTARFEAHARVVPGDLVEVAVATDRLRFFDPATGRAIR
jgi:multiple sugar transport system ATP-binding protein